MLERRPSLILTDLVGEVDPPFFQQQTSDSSSADLPPNIRSLGPPPATMGDQSSSADDYRSIVDDLTVQIQRLREENKRLRSKGPDVMKNQQLFEVRCHDLLSRRKKRELEATLREFAASLKDTQSGRTSGGSSQHKKSSSSRNPKGIYSSGSRSMSKNASSVASQYRPVDSAYASGSGPYSSGTSLTRPSLGSVQSSGRKVENYLREIPEGLYQGPIILTDKDKKKMVVRRLEQIFTGRITGRSLVRSVSKVGPSTTNPTLSAPGSGPMQVPPQTPQDQAQPQAEPRVTNSVPGSLQPPLPPPPQTTSIDPLPNREAPMLPRDGGNKGRSRDNFSMSNSNSNGDDRGRGNSQVRPPSTNAAIPNSPISSPFEQRPTRPLDLDPDRVQVPSENMEYLRHLGLVPPALLQGSNSSPDDVPTDADGWVYLNLLCNMAQLHIFSVTPDFIRAAVSEKSTKFQLSRDGNKVRWRGGCEGTKFSSDGSGDNSQRSTMTDETEDSEKGERHNKRQKINLEDRPSASSSKHTSQFQQQTSQCSPSTFHYKPLFARNDSSQETSADGSSSNDPDESHHQESQWGRSGSGSNQRRRKRRAHGAVIYYSGAPFCTDLSRDPGEFSSDTCMLSEEQGVSVTPSATENAGPALVRTMSGSSLQFRPLSDGLNAFPANDDAGGVDSDDTEDIEMEMPWSDSQQVPDRQPMQASGTFGIEPQDHFIITVTTRRPPVGFMSENGEPWEARDTTEFIIGRLASMSTASPIAGQVDLRRRGHMGRSLAIDYVSRDLVTLAPSPVPEPLSLVPYTDTASSYNSTIASSQEISTSEEVDSIEELMSRRANPHHSDVGSPGTMDLSSGAVADGDADEMMAGGNGDPLSDDADRLASLKSKGSSAAAAGSGVESGYTSGAEDSPL
jgi:hypothetical protein